VARGIAQLHMDASINAEAFYRRAGYDVIARGTHRLRTGHEMACIRMSKRLRGSDHDPEASTRRKPMQPS
jgi:hypothetical protein